MTPRQDIPAFPRSALQTTLFYVIAGSAWITVSDALLEHLGADAYQLTLLETLKGLLFIGITAIILYFLISRLLRRISLQQAALLASEQRLLLALEATGDGVWDWDLVDNSCFYSSGWKQILGSDGHEIATSPDEWFSRIHPDDRERHREALQRHLAGETRSHQSEYRLRCDDGSYKWIENRGKVVSRDAQGTPLRMLGTLRDISVQKKAEEEHRQQSELLRIMGSMRALDEELQRHQLATALHDGVGQLLAMARIKLSILRNSLSPGDAHAPLTGLQETLDEAISATRSLTVEISPPILYQFGLGAALEGLVETFRNRHGLPATYREEGRAEPLNEGARIFLYQSTRELLMNALKHANAAAVVVACVRQEESVVVTVADDGVGFAPPGPAGMPGSYGLFSIAERMHHLGGTLTISSAPGAGTKIELTAPVIGR